MELVPVLQLRAEDFPEVAFKPGSDLLQLLWCPLDHEDDEGTFVAKPFLFWRKRSDIVEPLPEVPNSPRASDWYLPRECRLFPERVTEYLLTRVDQKMVERAREWLASNETPKEIRTEDDWLEFCLSEHGPCPSNKVGGFPRWIQAEETPTCSCGQQMQYLLTLTDSEFDGGDWRRWCPIEESTIRDDIYLRPATMPKTPEELEALEGILDPARFSGFVGGAMIVFICRSCEGWPIRSVFQR